MRQRIGKLVQYEQRLQNVRRLGFGAKCGTEQVGYAVGAKQFGQAPNPLPI